ncbi:unnamed protein product [Adineta steineri]|uniref:Uncharacterized protein n=1 Tax=Adineta steineri TaxID=433720 RepID=A0A819S5F8_9BILA|nr:unnamed protein product [Adineta steineri]
MSFQSFDFPPLHPNPGVIVAIQSLHSDTNTTTAIPEDTVNLLAINEESELWKLQLHSGQAEKLLSIQNIPDLNIKHPLQIVISPNGKYAAVSNQRGRYAALFDLYSREQLPIKLERDGYHSDKSVFPLAFIEIPQGRTLLIHGSEWNRLDITDILSGENLSERPSPRYDQETKARPEHYLEYFHGQLHVSPDGKTVAETGWIWHPMAETRCWNIEEWLDNNRWESEDGASLRCLWPSLLDWDVPMTWLDSNTLAVWGKVDEDMIDKEDEENEEVEINAVFWFDVKSGKRLGRLLSVPTYTMTPDTSLFPYTQAKMVAANGQLFLWNKGIDFSVWNIETGQCESKKTDFQPDLYHAPSGLFLIHDAEHGGQYTAWRYSQLPKSS